MTVSEISIRLRNKIFRFKSPTQKVRITQILW